MKQLKLKIKNRAKSSIGSLPKVILQFQALSELSKNRIRIFIITICILISYLTFFPSPTKAAVFTLEPQSRTVAPGETFSVDIKIDTQGVETTSADALLDFDSSILQADSVTPGSFYPQTFKTASASQIYVGGAVKDASQSRTGVGLMATVNFKAVGSGTSSFSFDCTPGKTADSNITKKDSQSAEDILDCSGLVNGSYLVSGSVTSTEPTPTPKELPGAGSVENTIIIGGLGLLLAVIGFAIFI